MAAGLDSPQGLNGRGRRARRLIGGALYRRPWLRGVGLFTPPVAAFTAVYVAALAVLFISAFWGVDPFAGTLIRHFSFDNFRTLWDQGVYHTIALRTIGIAAAVTIGRPAGSHGPVRRAPMSELVHGDEWGVAPAWAVDPPDTRHTARFA